VAFWYVHKSPGHDVKLHTHRLKSIVCVESGEDTDVIISKQVSKSYN